MFFHLKTYKTKHVMNKKIWNKEWRLFIFST